MDLNPRAGLDYDRQLTVIALNYDVKTHLKFFLLAHSDRPINQASK
jgi:hypothetical protein